MPKIVTPPSDTTSLHFRRLVCRDVLKEREREILEVEIKDMAEYRDTEEQRAKAMHVVDPRTEEEKEAEAALQQEMLKVRTTLCPLFFCTHVYWPAAWGLAGWPLGLGGGGGVRCGTRAYGPCLRLGCPLGFIVWASQQERRIRGLTAAVLASPCALSPSRSGQ